MTRRRTPKSTTGVDDVDLALQGLRAVITSPDAPAAAVAQAARTLLEYKGFLGRHAKPTAAQDARPLAEMTAADLRAELERIRSAV